MSEKLLSIGITLGSILVTFIISAVINGKLKKAKRELEKAMEAGETEKIKELQNEVDKLEDRKEFLEILVEVPQVVKDTEQILYQPGSGKGKKLLATTQIEQKCLACGLEVTSEKKKEIDEQIEKVLEAPTKKEEQ